MNNTFDFSKEPGKKLNRIEFEKDYEPLISIIMPFYNDKDTIEQSVNSVLNQTFPAYELLIIDDGSNDKESLEKLKEVEKLDKRIKVLHKENGGASMARDFAAKKVAKSSKYLVFLDSDDLIEPTYLECAYWTLETHKEATWAYSDSVGFGELEYTWNKWFDSEKMKRENDLVITSMVRKDAFLEVNGFDIYEKNVFEDWNLWLKFIAKGEYPVRINFYGSWYRRKKTSELVRARENKKRAMEIIAKTNETIKEDVEAIQFPKYDYNWDIIPDKNNDVLQVKQKGNKKIKLLMIIPWMVMGGADKFNLDFINGLEKEKYDVTIITTEPAINLYRQKYKENATTYDLTTFLDQKDWVSFVNYIIEKNNINIIMNTNSETGYSFLPYLKALHPEIPIIDYVHMEEWYNRNGGYSRDSSGVKDVIDKTLTCNGNSTDILIDHFGRKRSEVQTVYIGVDEKKFNPENYNKKELLKEYGINKKYVIGFICRITEQKRPLLLVEIAKKLKKERNDFVILVAGTGNLLSDLKTKVLRSGLNENFKFIGNITETQKFYKMCDLTLNCSIKEGLALTSYESLAMDVPVISSDVGGQKELINNDTGVIVPLLQDEEDIYDCTYSQEEIDLYVTGIEKILNNLDKYKNKCRKRILNGFTIDHMVSEMKQILKETVENPNSTKIDNGKALAQNADICKELIVQKLASNQIKYEWQCKEYNSYYGFKSTNYKFLMFKDRMWKHAWYRGLIKFLQKIGVIKLIKKSRNLKNSKQ